MWGGMGTKTVTAEFKHYVWLHEESALLYPGCAGQGRLCIHSLGRGGGDSEQPCEDYSRHSHHSMCPDVGLLQKELCKLLLWTTADPSRGQEAAPSIAELC